MILVGGEALVDLVPELPSADGLAPLSPRLGGGPYNAAIAASRLGVPTAFLSRVSTDAFGRALLARLAESEVDTSLVQRGPEPTSLAVVDVGADGSAQYSFYMAETADRLVDEPASLPVGLSAVCLGTLGLVLEPGASRYEALLRRVSDQGVVTMLDPNIRAQLIADPDAYRARFRSWLSSVDVLKLSDDDAAWLAEVEAVADEAAEAATESPIAGVDPRVLAEVRRWQQAGPTVVILTRGSAGLVAVLSDGRSVEVPGVAVEVVDTIGAGDTVSGAVLAWLHEHSALSAAGLRALTEQQWAECLSFAASASAVTCSRPGAEPPWAAELS
ncbi:carbohydrate kinase family protein [Actinoalloteichus hymeniacidonis]|uniref:Sugar kinase, ribokinase n=1 Tax=Actinoalloteichus hymeniacidonis TaxID=340345 RepID=A0AAC9HUZ1_9PSEU|nr:carbohydrate kinase [Actinoalloteichus hymeniacidonis]AOS65800.1 sugar kinase, ribokinase [Actinoalloteichus hymeniacidonis]MBB5906109.1 fructokinase [Actinoalloteichus hymeniacidonis]